MAKIGQIGVDLFHETCLSSGYKFPFVGSFLKFIKRLCVIQKRMEKTISNCLAGKECVVMIPKYQRKEINMIEEIKTPVFIQISGTHQL